MKVKIGRYRHRMVSDIHTNYMNWKYSHNWKDDYTNLFEKILYKLEDFLQTVYNKTINKILDERSAQKVSVKIDRHDVWSMDHTLAHIIHPMLIKMKEDLHGAPFVDDEDVPDHLKSTSAPPKENDYDVDDNHFARWDYVLDEMIWAFGQKLRDGWEDDYYEHEDDPSGMFGLKLVWEDREGMKTHQERMRNGFRLFGKYYENLWT